MRRLWLALFAALLLVVYAIGDRPAASWARIPATGRGVIISAGAAVVAYLLLFHGLGSQEFVYSQF